MPSSFSKGTMTPSPSPSARHRAKESTSARTKPAFDGHASSSTIKTRSLSQESVRSHSTDVNKSYCCDEGTELLGTPAGGDNDNYELQYVGRSKFLKSIQALYKNKQSTLAASVIIQGASSSGKTRLFQQLRLRERYSIYISFEKQDELLHPYAAFFSGLDVFLAEFLRGNRTLATSPRDMHVLRSYLPSLNCYVIDEETSTKDTQSFDALEGSMIALLRWILHEIQVQDADDVETRCSLVLLLDDLQYSNPSARRLISRLQRKFKRSFVVLGCCHLVHEYSDSLADWLIEQKQAGTQFRLLPNWTSKNVLQVVRLYEWHDSAENIAQATLTRTRGHIGSVLLLLRLARDLKYLTARSILSIPMPHIKEINKQGYKHIDDAAIMRHLLKIQIRALPPLVRACLLAAAEYMPRFGAESISYFVQQPVDAIHGQLLYAHERGLLLQVSDKLFVFESDTAKEVVKSLSGKEKCLDMQWRIGRRLQQFYFQRNGMAFQPAASVDVHRIMMRSVDHMNRGAVGRRDLTAHSDESGSVNVLVKGLTELNSRAARVCLESNEYFPAAVYLEKSIEFLGSSPWRNHFSRMLELETLLLQAKYRCGSFNESEQHCLCVISHTNNISNRKVAVHTLISIMQKRRCAKDAIQLIVNELNELHDPFPSKFLAVEVKNQMKVIQKRLVKFNWDVWCKRSNTRGREVIDRMELIERLVECTLQESSSFHSLALLRAFQMTIDFGHFPVSSLCFTYWGSLLREMGNVDAALSFGSYGLTLAEAKLHPVFDARATVVYHSNISQWIRDTKGVTDELLQSISLLCGESGMVCTCVNHVESFWYFLMFGNQFHRLTDSLAQLAILLDDHNQDHLLSLVRPWTQLATALTISTETSTQSGAGRTQYCEEKLEDFCRQDPDAKSSLLCRMLEAFFFDKMETTEGLFSEFLDVSRERQKKDHEEAPPIVFFVGLVALMLATKPNVTRSEFARYRKTAEAMIRKLDAHVKQGYRNCHHLTLLLRAQYLACKASPVELSKIVNAFDSAIAAAHGKDAVLVQALACERAAHFFLAQRVKSNSVGYIKRSIDLFRRCGARNKVRHMLDRYSGLIGPGPEC